MDKIKEQLQEIATSIPFWKIFGVLVALEIISFGGFQFPLINQIVFWVILVVTFALSIKRLQLGILVLFAELVVGSKGYLFSFPIGDQMISIRLGLFCVVFLAYFVWVIREKKIRFFSWPLWKPYAFFIGALALAVIVGVLRGNSLSTTFLDANGYLYFGLIGPLTQAIRDRRDIYQLLAVFCAAALVMMGETIILLFLFTHLETFTYTLPEVYRWIRNTGVGEITRFSNGYARVFFQSHIYAVFVFFVSGVLLVLRFADRTAFPRAKGYFYCLAEKQMRWQIGLFALSAITIFLSYSRSFWVGVVATLPIVATWLLWKEHIGFKRMAATVMICGAICILDYALVVGIVNFPLPGHVSVRSSSLLTERTGNISEEPAASTRWQLLRPLVDASLEHPIFGSGFGRTITYISNDLRVREQFPDGRYTTYAFEWGYLDLWLKMGIVGVAAYTWLVISVLRAGLVQRLEQAEMRPWTVGVMAAFIALLAVHVFTPYLNHPLGIGWVLFASVFFTMKFYEHDN
jgi:hypothetical protein